MATQTTMPTPTPGRVVNFIMADGDIRPAIVVRAWSSVLINAVLFLDGRNDRGLLPASAAGGIAPENVSHEVRGGATPYGEAVHALMTVWVTSATYAPADSVHPEEVKPGTWHWPPRPETCQQLNQEQVINIIRAELADAKAELQEIVKKRLDEFHAPPEVERVDSSKHSTGGDVVGPTQG